MRLVTLERQKGCGLKTALVFPNRCDCPQCDQATFPWRWVLMGLRCWWGSQTLGHPPPAVTHWRGHAVSGNRLRADSASPHVPKALERGVPSAQGFPEGRLGSSSSSVPSARYGVVPMAQEASCQTEGHCTLALCFNCHITRARPRWTPQNSHSSPPNLPAGDRTLWRNSGRGPHTSVVWIPFPRQGVRIPAPHTWGPCSPLTLC